MLPYATRMDARPSIDELDTPALVCDLDVLERNIQPMAAHCRDLNLPLRAHVKTHKSRRLRRCKSPPGLRAVVARNSARLKLWSAPD
jgi:D-serine deaminase-like pyridoxal phosphate-dependent protein